MLIDLCLPPQYIEDLERHLQVGASKPTLVFITKTLLPIAKEKHFDYLGFRFTNVKLEYYGTFKDKVHYVTNSYNVNEIKLNETANKLREHFNTREPIIIN